MRYAAVARHFGVEATHELSLHCALALRYGEHFAAEKTWQAALQKLKEKTMSLVQVATEIELNDLAKEQT